MKYEIKLTLLLELPVSWCSVSQPPTTWSCWPFSKLTFKSIGETKQNKKKIYAWI